MMGHGSFSKKSWLQLREIEAGPWHIGSKYCQSLVQIRTKLPTDLLTD